MNKRPSYRTLAAICAATFLPAAMAVGGLAGSITKLINPDNIDVWQPLAYLGHAIIPGIVTFTILFALSIIFIILIVKQENSKEGKMRKLLLIILFGCMLNAEAQLPMLKISANKRFFQTADGKPFFWLGDTGWLLFIKCKKEDAIKYLDDRKQKGYNVIQVMLIHDISLGVNAYGDSSIHNKDVSKLVIKDEHGVDDLQYGYWDHVDFIIDEAANTLQ